MVETKKVRLGDKIYIEKTLYCNYCKKEILRYKKIIIFDVDKCYKNEKIETLEWIENVVCPHCNKINKSLSLDE